MEQSTGASEVIAKAPADDTIEEITRQANSFLAKSDLRQAYPYVCQLAKREEVDPKIGVTAGLIALTLNKKDEAARHFLNAREREPDNFDANYNLALLHIAEGNFDNAMEIFLKLTKLQPQNAALHNDLAIIWMNKNDTQQALQSFEKALQHDPNFTKARENCMQFILKYGLIDDGKRILQINSDHPQVSDATIADIKKWHSIIDKSSNDIRISEVGNIEAPPPKDGLVEARPSEAPVDCQLKGRKLAFFANHLTFIKDIIHHLSQDNETRTYNGNSVQEMRDLMRWADVAWFEWCDSLIIEATKLPKSCPIICRLHSYEVFTDMPGRVDWSKVDRLIFVNQSVEEIFKRQVCADVPITVIQNGVDISRYKIPSNKVYGKRIASVGYINYKKNPTLLLYCFKKIHAYDSEYSLHIAGQHQDPRIQVYFEHFLRENPLPVHFHGWVEDMPAWYADKDFVISTSLFESFHYSIAEGMASGLLPLIHDWYGAKETYSREFLFTDPDDCLSLLKRLEKADRYRLAQENRQFIVERYNQEDKYEQILKQLISITANSPVEVFAPEEECI